MVAVPASGGLLRLTASRTSGWNRCAAAQPYRSCHAIAQREELEQEIAALENEASADVSPGFPRGSARVSRASLRILRNVFRERTTPTPSRMPRGTHGTARGTRAIPTAAGDRNFFRKSGMLPLVVRVRELYAQPMILKAIIHDAEEGGFWAEVPALPGCFTQGETLAELETNLREAIEGWLLSAEPEGGKSSERILEVAV